MLVIVFLAAWLCHYCWGNMIHTCNTCLVENKGDIIIVLAELVVRG